MLEIDHDIAGIAFQNNANFNFSTVRACPTLGTPIPRPPRPYTRLVVCTEFLS